MSRKVQNLHPGTGRQDELDVVEVYRNSLKLFITDAPFMEPLVKRLMIVKGDEETAKLVVQFKVFADILNIYDLSVYSLPQIVVDEGFFIRREEGGRESKHNAFLF